MKFRRRELAIFSFLSLISSCAPTKFLVPRKPSSIRQQLINANKIYGISYIEDTYLNQIILIMITPRSIINEVLERGESILNQSGFSNFPNVIEYFSNDRLIFEDENIISESKFIESPINELINYVDSLRNLIAKSVSNYIKVVKIDEIDSDNLFRKSLYFKRDELWLANMELHLDLCRLISGESSIVRWLTGDDAYNIAIKFSILNDHFVYDKICMENIEYKEFIDLLICAANNNVRVSAYKNASVKGQRVFKPLG